MKALADDDITSSIATQSSGGDELRRPRSREDEAPPRPDRGKTARWQRWNDCSERWGRLMYPEFQAYFRKHKPPFLAVWGKNDPFFLPAGAKAFQRDMVKDTANSHPESALWGDGWGWSWFDAGDRSKTTTTNYRAQCLACHACFGTTGARSRYLSERHLSYCLRNCAAALVFVSGFWTHQAIAAEPQMWSVRR